MPCPQDPDLLSHSISVDDFSLAASFYMLTHAHSDHMRGLSKHFGKNRQGSKIYCTRVTMDLSIMAIQGLDQHNFHIIPYNQAFRLNQSVTVWSFPSYHCDGACMFLFEILGELRIVYTGDFRFHNEMRKNSLLTDMVIDRLYYDDLFDEITIDYPSYQESLTHMLSCITMLQDRGHKRINIHCSILGLESILREITDTTNIKFGLLPEIRDTWRGQQLKYLLDERLDEKRVLPVSLGSYKLDSSGSNRSDRSNQIPWIIPTCTYFICDKEHQKKTPSHHFYVWFCTHSNQKENTQLKVMISAKEVNACKNALTKLTCRK